MKAKAWREYADRVFSKRTGLLTLWQEMAENFYPERADFTVQRHVGAEFASNLSTSFPIICRRELAGAFPTMLRPTHLQWFEAVPKFGKKVDNDAKKWLEHVTGIQRRAMYDLKSRFSRAVIEGDHDYASFGQDVMQIRLNDNKDTLFYRCHHLRDVAWVEDEEGNVCPIFRKWKPYASYLVKKFPETVDDKIKRLAQKEPYAEVECYHFILKMDEYEDDFVPKRLYSGKFPYVSVYYDCMNHRVLEAIPTFNKEYVVERWQTVSGSQYAYSPATVAALPDARLLQAMTYTLLEAGEKATNPPMVATEGAVRSDVSIYAGGITWVDLEYDERLGEALRPLASDKSGLPIGIDMQRDCRSLLKLAFFTDKLKPFLPTEDPQMTAYQAGQIVAQYIRDALPIFEPMESERNGQVCEMTFDILFRGGAFGSPFDIPESLQGEDIGFQFQSPLHDAIESQKGQKFLEMKGLIAEAVALDSNSAAVPNVVDALRDALNGIKVPGKWMRSESEVEEMIAAENEKRATEELLAQYQQGAQAAQQTGQAMNEMAQAQIG